MLNYVMPNLSWFSPPPSFLGFDEVLYSSLWPSSSSSGQLSSVWVLLILPQAYFCVLSEVSRVPVAFQGSFSSSPPRRLAPFKISALAGGMLRKH